MTNKNSTIDKLRAIALKNVFKNLTPEKMKLLGIKTPAMTLTELINLYNSKITHKEVLK
jgi:hypothetical protein